MATKKPAQPMDGIKILPTGEIHIRVTYKDPLSTRRWERELTLPSSTTTKQAILKREEIYQSLKEKANPKPVEETFAEYSLKYLKSKEGTVKSITIKNISSLLRNYILPYIGEYHIKSITNLEMGAYLGQLKTSNFSESTQFKAWNTALEILRSAFESYDIKDKTKRLKFRPKEINNPKGTVLEVYQIKQLYDLTQEMQPSAKALIQIYIFTGMRRAEVALLKRSDVDLENGWIRPSYTKGESSNKRNIPLTYFVIGSIKEHLKGVPESIWLFPHQDRPSEPMRDIRGAELLIRYGKKMNPPVDITLHDLRRSFITNLHRAGAMPAAIQHVVGHGKAKTAHDLYIKPNLNDYTALLSYLESWIAEPVPCP